MGVFTVDGTAYDVQVVYGSLKRSFDVRDGENAGTAKAGNSLRDVVGTYYNYQLTVRPKQSSRDDYDALYEVISAPVATHTVTLPYGQSTITFLAEIVAGSDVYQGVAGSAHRWDSLTITFRANLPARRPM